MQQRRGTAAQWISVNNGSGPILAAGEIGFESDTNKFKIGDGVNHWVDLTYFTDAASVLTAVNNLVDGAPDLLNTLNEVAAALGDDPNFFSTMATNLSNHEADTTNVHGIADTTQLATKTYADGKASDAKTGAEATAATALSAHEADTTNVHGIPDTSVLAKTTTGTQFDGDTHANNIITTDLTVSNVITAKDITLSGDLTVNGTTTTVNATNLDVTDAMIYIASGNTSNSLDIGVVGAYDNGTYQHTGIVRDATDGKWKIFDGLQAEPGSAIDFVNAPLGALEVGPLVASGAKIGDVTNAELQRVHGVTSQIQDQLDSASTRLDAAEPAISSLQSDLSDANVRIDQKQPILSGTHGINIVGTAYQFNAGVYTHDFTDVNGNVISDKSVWLPAQSLVSNSMTKTVEQWITFLSASYSATFTEVTNVAALDFGKVQRVVDGVSDVELSYINGLTSNAQLQLDNKLEVSVASATYAPIENPTFQTSVHLPADTTIGDISSTELSYINGVTSSIQTQLDAKATASNLTSHESATTSVHGIADTAALATKSYVDNAGSALQTNIDDKAPIDSPTFTGTVSGISATMVGLGNVDNTSDANKPISTATQTALDAKASLSGATFTGDVSGTNLTLSGNLTVNGTTTTVSSQNLEVTDPLIYIGTGNSANSKDLGIVGHYDNGTYQHTGLVRDASDNKWKLFTGITTEPSDVIDFTTYTKDSLVVGALEATTVTPSSGIVFSDGTQTLAGTPSLTPINAQTASITLGSSFVKDSFVKMNVASANTITIPTDATYTYPVGASIDFQQAGAGQTSFVAASGVTFEVAQVNGADALKFRGRYSVATALKTAANTWAIFGDLTN